MDLVADVVEEGNQSVLAASWMVSPSPSSCEFCSDRRVSRGVFNEVTGLKGVPSTAVDGNLLEAINLALNKFDKHYIDRDLRRTGQAVVLITAGTGVWLIDRTLIELTKERLVDNGRRQLLCLGKCQYFPSSYILFVVELIALERKTNIIINFNRSWM